MKSKELFAFDDGLAKKQAPILSSAAYRGCSRDTWHGFWMGMKMFPDQNRKT